MVLDSVSIQTTTTATTASSRLNESATSTASPETSLKLTSSESDKLSPGAPTHIAGTMGSTRPTNLVLGVPRSGSSSFSANNSNTPLTPRLVGDGGLNAGTKIASHADGGSSPSGATLDQRGSFTSDRDSLHSVDVAVSPLQATRESDPTTFSPALFTSAPPSGRHGLFEPVSIQTTTTTTKASSRLNESATSTINVSPGALTHILDVLLSGDSPSRSANNLNYESNTPLTPELIGDGGLNAGTNSASDADGGSPPSGATLEQRVSFDSDPVTVSPLQATRESDAITSSPALLTSAPPSDHHGLNLQRGSAGFESPNIDLYPNSGSPSPSHSWSRAATLHNLLLLGLPTIYLRNARAYFKRMDSNSQGRVGGESAHGIPFHGNSCLEEFMDSLLRDWNVVNTASPVLILAIGTILLLSGAADDPITRSTALLSLICALVSFLYGCIYTVGSGTMRMYWDSKWAEEVRKTSTVKFWSVWVFLALPLAWMYWSMVLSCTSILSFIWRTKPGSKVKPGNDSSSGPSFSTPAIWGSNVAMTGVVMLGLMYLAMIVKTLRRYGRQRGDLEMAMSLAPVSEPEGSRGVRSTTGVHRSHGVGGRGYFQKRTAADARQTYRFQPQRFR